MPRHWLRDRSPREASLGRRAFLGHAVSGLGTLAAPTLFGCGVEQFEPDGGLPGRDAGSGGHGSAGRSGGDSSTPGDGGRGAFGGASSPGEGGSGAGSPDGSTGVTPRSTLPDVGPLMDPDENGVRLPEGFSCRIVARYGEPPPSTSAYHWHGAPDGGATFPAEDGGWIYVSNAEMAQGGVGALRFAPDGTVTDAYPILQGTRINCAGGATPWGTWLSCEEVPDGRVFECDPTGRNEAIVRPALGLFRHEAAALDPVHHHVYLTEDVPDGRLYRFVPDRLTPEGFADLSGGRLEVARVDLDGQIVWLGVPDPAGLLVPTRLQVPDSTVFSGGEGIFYHQGVVYFTTKFDNRVWAYDTRTSRLRLVYDQAFSPTPILQGADNVVVSCCGDVLVAEDGGDMQLVVILPDRQLKPFLQIEGQPYSEITGPAFSPAGDRLYLSSQRAGATTLEDGGITYEISGPFLSLV